MKKIALLFVSVLFVGCSTLTTKTTHKLQLKFLDEYVVPDSLVVDGTLVGGLSGIDYKEGTYFLICDDASNPRYYKATININLNTISKIHFNKVYKIKDTTNYLDMEAIRYDTKRHKIVITSEGSIRHGVSPSLFTINSDNHIHKVKIPDMFSVNSIQKPRNNGTLEGLCISKNEKGYWIAMELPLKGDGPEPTYQEADSPVRITYIDAAYNKPNKQFTYYLEPISKKPTGRFGVNGVTDILEYSTDKFFVLERAFSSGWGTQGNTVRIFKANASKATNTINKVSLKEKKFKPASKELLLDLEDIRNQLTNAIIDNIEGMTFGPTLPNGNKTLLLVSDNNFNRLGKQLNQFILLEIEN